MITPDQRARARNALLSAIPWVRPLINGRRCEGITSRRRDRCCLLAHWEFDALPGSGAASGHYCLRHLTAQMTRHSRELRRLTQWRREHGDTDAFPFHLTQIAEDVPGEPPW